MSEPRRFGDTYLAQGIGCVLEAVALVIVVLGLQFACHGGLR